MFLECGLTIPHNVTYSMGLFYGNQIIATGSLSGDMIQGLAVSPRYQGEDLSAKVLTHLMNYAVIHGITALYLFTKPTNTDKFVSMGFNIVAIAKPYTALLEWGAPGIKDYIQKLASITDDDPGESSAIVMNCNPFTLGHLSLIETAAARDRKVYVLVVEEDLSAFPFQARFEMIKKGTAHLSNVVVIPGNRYIVSSMTFPSYFTRDRDLAAAHCAIDVEIFLEHIAPALGVTKRYVGTEPFSPVTAIYNQTMKERLTPGGIQVIEVERITYGDQVISASYVRRLLAANKLDEIRKLVPDVTFEYLLSDAAVPVIRSIIGGVGYCEDA
nr:[citrate (pro-3S)-lyase] ligase [Anaerosolibacter carboniphilus]